MSKSISEVAVKFRDFRQKVSGVIVNTKGEILIGRYVGDLKYGLDKWTLPGGGLEEYESPMECLYREIHEEVGIHKTKFGKILKLGTFQLEYTDSISTWLKELKGFSYKGKFDTIYILEYLGQDHEVNLTYCNEFCAYKWVDIYCLKEYLNELLCNYLVSQGLKEKIDKILSFNIQKGKQF